MQKLKDKLVARVTDYIMKLFSIRFSAFIGGEYAILEKLDGQELWTHVVQALVAAGVAIFYIWSEQVRPTLGELTGKK